MIAETAILLGCSALSLGYWYFWHQKYQNQERNIRGYRTLAPPRYDAIDTTPAPPYQEITPPPPIDPPQY